MALRCFARFSVLLLCVATTASVAQDYPTKAVRLIIPFSPGGGADITGRLLARKLGEMHGQQVVVDNRAGAGTVIGSDILAKSPPDDRH